MRRTESDLEKMAGHVQYEIDEFRSSFDALVKMGSKRPPEWNRTVESLLLHFRALRGFFFQEKMGDDDVFAHDFIPEWPHKRSEANDAANILGKTRSAINKRLAHLTVERLTDYPWKELDEMNGKMERLVNEFVDKLSPQRAVWFPHLRKLPVLLVLGNSDNSTCSAQVVYGFIDPDSLGALKK